MKIETLKERIANAEKKVTSKRNTIEKKTALQLKKIAKRDTLTDEREIRWLDSEIEWLADDIDRLGREVREAQDSLDKYREQMAHEIEKAHSRNVPAIIDFLNRWQERVFNFYNVSLEPCYKMKEEKRKLGEALREVRWGSDEYDTRKAAYDAVHEELWGYLNGYYEKVKYINRFGKEAEKRVKVADGEWEYLHPYESFKTYEEGAERLRSDLKQEADRKYDFIIERVNAICGKITDASGLKVGAKGDLNGYIIGERGTAHVQTIGAGGYNIQCFHFRTLIHEAK